MKQVSTIVCKFDCKLWGCRLACSGFADEIYNISTCIYIDIGASDNNKRFARAVCRSRNPQVLEGDELQILEETVQQYETATRRALDFSDVNVAPLPLAPLPPQPEPQDAEGLRIHGADVQLTFNKAAWRSGGQEAETWFIESGTQLVARFQSWALEELPKKFREPIKHCSLTLEESGRAAGGVDRVHLHAQLTFARRIDRTSSKDFIFDGVRPHIVAWVGS